jgi:hypothetical protein
MGVPEHIRNRQEGDVELESGLKVRVRLPNARDLMFGGGMAWPVIERMAELEKKSEGVSELTDQEKAELYAFQREQVARMLLEVEGETVECDPDDLGWLSDAEFYELVGYLMRSKPLHSEEPGKA